MQTQQSVTPFSKMVLELRHTLLKNGVSETTERRYRQIYGELGEYLGDSDYSDESAAQFLVENYGTAVDFLHREAIRPALAVKALLLLSDYFKGVPIANDFLLCEQKTQWPPNPLKEFQVYIDSLEFKRFSKSYQEACIWRFKKFAYHLHENKITSCKEISAKVLVDYILALKLKKSSKTVYIVQLRSFVKFLYLHDYIDTDLSDEFPVISRNVPDSAYRWSTEGIQKLLACLDRANPKEARDYAIIMLISKTGLRISDVTNLSFADIKWDRNTIELVQKKTKTPLNLPLIPEVGEAIIDYLKYHRPKVESPRVFLTQSPPFRELAENNHLYDNFTIYQKRAGIKIPIGKRHGLHSLRHALATNLIENNVSLITVSEILGHNDLKSAATYLRVSIELLRECALNPEVFYRD